MLICKVFTKLVSCRNIREWSYGSTHS